MMKLIQKVADWFSDGGIILLCKIGYYITLVLTFLQPVAALIVLITVDLHYPAIYVAVIFGTIVVFFIDLILCGLELGLVQFLQDCISTKHKCSSMYYEQKEKAEPTTKTFEAKESVYLKEEKQTKKTISYDGVEVPEGHAIFLTNYFGSDDKHNPIRLTAGTVVKIIKHNDNATYNVEYKDGSKKHIVPGVQPHYLKINK